MPALATLLVGNGRLITRDPSWPIIEDGGVAVAGDRILAVGETSELRAAQPGVRFLDACGGLIMPGLINTHTHLYSAFARGMALKEDSPQRFTEILERLWWRLDRTLDLEAVYLSAMVGMVDCIRNGVTTIFDHHSSPSAVEGSLFHIADAAVATGVRSCLCYEVTDREGAEVADLSIRENLAFLERCGDGNEPLLRGLFGLHASFTIGAKTLDRAVSVASILNSSFHIHVAEDRADVEHCQREFGKRVVERLRDAGVLGPRTFAAHCIHIDDNEIGILRESRTNVIHNPESNMGNAVGCAQVLEMMRRGVNVGLGTDGYTADMLESLKVANLLHKHQSGSPSAAWSEPPAMLFQENARIASECFGNQLGQLVPGALADLIVVDYDPPTPFVAGNCDSHLLFGVPGRAVTSTVVGGRILMQERKLATLDERDLMAKAREAAARIWQRF